MRRLIHWLARRHHSRNATSVAPETRVAKTSPLPDDTPLLFQVVVEKRRVRETEGRQLFQELERRRAQAHAAEPVRAAAPDPIPAATVAPTPVPVALSEPLVIQTAEPKVSRPRRPRLPRLAVPAFPSALRRRLLVSVPILAVAFAIVTVGIAYWTTGGSGSASASAGTLDPASISAPGTSTGSVTITWDSPAEMSPSSQNSNVTYMVERKLNAGSFVAVGSGPCSGSLARLIASCTDTVGVSGTYTYRAVARFSTAWTATSNEESVVVNVDTTAPEVESITIDDDSPTNASEVHWTVTFDEDVTGVDAGDFDLVGSGSTGSAAITDVSGSGDEYTVTADTGDDGVLGLDLVDNDTIEDLAGNPLGGTGAGNGDFTTGETYLVDRTAPSVSSITRDGVSPTNAASVSWTVTFSEDVENVDASDFTLTTSGLSGTPAVGTVTPITDATYTVTASTGTATPSGSGTIRLNVTDDDSIEDGVGNKLGGTGAGNGNFTTGQTYAIDKTQPTVSSINRTGTNPTNAGPLTWAVTFSEPVNNVTTGNFSLTTNNTGGSAPAVTSATAVGGAPATVWNVSVSTAGTTGANNGSIRLDLSSVGTIQDPATNLLAGTFNTGQAYTYDTTQPAVSSINRTGTNPTNAGPLTWAVTFSEPVNNVTTGNFSLTTANTTGSPSVTSATPVGGAPATVWNVSVSTAGVTGANNGSIRLDLSSVGTIQDVATNLLAGTFTTGQAYTYDTTPPAVNSINRVGASPTNATSVQWSVTFSETVTGVNSGDFALVQAGGVTGALITSVTGTGPYTVTASTGSNSGTLGLNLVDDDSIQDGVTNKLGGTGAGNGNFTGDVYAIDKTPPFVTSINRSDASPTNATSVQWSVNFSESVTGVNSADFTLVQAGGVTGASITTVTGAGNGPYTVTASTGSNSGTLGLNLVDDNSIVDGVGNALGSSGGGANGTFTGQVYTIDKTAPVVSSVNRVGASPTNATSVQWTVTFSETVSGVDATDFTLVQAGGVTGASITNVTGSGPYTVTANTGSNSGTLGLNLVDDDSIADAVGNKLGGTGAGNGNFAGQVYTIDRTAPTVTNITLNNSGTLGRVNSDDTVVITFSEDMNAMSFCSSWVNDGSNQPLNGNGQVVVTVNNVGSSDTLTVATTTGCTFQLGTIGLAADYVNASTSFSGNGSNASTLTWNPTAKTLTVKLGGNSTVGSQTSVPVSTPTFTANTAITDRAGNAIGAGPYTGTSSRF